MHKHVNSTAVHERRSRFTLLFNVITFEKEKNTAPRPPIIYLSLFLCVTLFHHLLTGNLLLVSGATPFKPASAVWGCAWKRRSACTRLVLTCINEEAVSSRWINRCCQTVRSRFKRAEKRRTDRTFSVSAAAFTPSSCSSLLPDLLLKAQKLSMVWAAPDGLICTSSSLSRHRVQHSWILNSPFLSRSRSPSSLSPT